MPPTELERDLHTPEDPVKGSFSSADTTLGNNIVRIRSGDSTSSPATTELSPHRVPRCGAPPGSLWHDDAMSTEPVTELERLITDLQRLEEAEGPKTAAGGMLHAARTILLEVARITEFGGKATDDL